MFFLTFGIVAVQLWKGTLRNRCYHGVTAHSMAICGNGTCAYDTTGGYYFDMEEEESQGLGSSEFCDCGPIPESQVTNC